MPAERNQTGPQARTDLVLATEKDFVQFAAAFARDLQAGDVVGLSGPLGAGKTTFVKAVVQERLGSDPVSSPTFTFWHRYMPQPTQASAGDPKSSKSAPSQATAHPHASESHGAPSPPIDHLDLYRVDDPSEVTELGLDDAFDGSSIVLVEWWRNAPGLLPPVRYEVDIQGKGSEPRRVTVRRAAGDRA